MNDTINKKIKPELLAPAGSMEKLKMALLYGADAVYLGGKNFGLRAFANNFDQDGIKEAVKFAHNLNKKIYVTVNIFAHNEDLELLPKYLLELEEANVDAVLISDFGIWNIAKEVVPNMSLHVSTQANNCNWASTQAWKDLGAERVVLARELSLKEIKKIHEKVDVELEAFVHGAMCISYSGRCLLSNYFTGRDGNRGACAQICRWEFELKEKNRPNEGFDIQEDSRGSYVFNSKDLCLIKYLDQIIEAGVCSLKVEGRMKSVHYVSTVISVYRKAINYWYENDEYIVKQEWLDELEKVSHRPYTEGFAIEKAGQDSQVYSSSSYIQSHDFVGIVMDYDKNNSRLIIEQRNNLKSTDEIEVLTPNGETFNLLLSDMKNSDNESIEVAPHPKQIFSIYCEKEIPKFSLLRRARIIAK